jgi:hypothetical protein
MALLQNLAEQGGTVIWSSVPPLTKDRDRWMAGLFGARVEQPTDPLGIALPARTIAFEGALDAVAPMTVLTDLVVDRVFAVRPLDGAECVARVRTGDPGGARCVGTRKATPGGGQAIYLGFRPRDDQSASTGTEANTWFELLCCLDAYPGDDNPTVVSRTSPYLACTFANGATAVCPHYRRHAESWPGGFFRDLELDARLMEENPPPDDTISLDGLRLAGQTIAYRGRHAVAWRLDKAGHLIAFSGRACTGIELDGRAYAWAETPIDVAWHPLGAKYAVHEYAPLYRAWCGTEGQIRLPLSLTSESRLQVWRGAHVPANGRNAVSGRVGYGYEQIPFSVAEGALILDVDAKNAEHWLYVVHFTAETGGSAHDDH